MTAGGWEASRWRRAQTALIPRLVAPAMRLLARTWRIEVQGAEQFDALTAGGRAPIIACWHQVILPGAVCWRDRGLVILASRNFDGEWITRTLRRFGFAAVRGSSSRGGAQALLTLARALRQGRGVAITVDGPRGPARRAQPGAIWLASRTGRAVLPFHVSAASAWRLGSWDKSVVPRPGSRVVMVVGAPLYLEADLEEAGIEAGRAALELALGDVERRAEAAAMGAS